MPKRHRLFAYAYDKRGRLISIGLNSYTRSTSLQRYFADKVGEPFKKFTHAEIDALVKAKGRPIHKLVIRRYNAVGDEVCSKPCKICEEALKAFGVKQVEYTI